MTVEESQMKEVVEIEQLDIQEILDIKATMIATEQATRLLLDTPNKLEEYEEMAHNEVRTLVVCIYYSVIVD